MNTKYATPTVSNETLTLADTQYSVTIPARTRQVCFQCQPDSNGIQRDIRYAWEAGKVATPTAPYSTLLAGQVFVADNLRTPEGLTLYLACAVAAQVVEVELYP